MDTLRQLLCAAAGSNQRTDCNAPVNETIPAMGIWFRDMETHHRVLISIGCAMTGAVLVLGIVHLIFVIKFISREQIRTDLYWLVFMAPVVAVCGSLGMILPKAAIFLYAIALVYFMLCLFVLVCLMTTLYGSRRAMCDKLLAKGDRMSIQVCPLGCCLCCFKKLEPTETNFRRFEWLVFQSPIVRILLEILNITVFMEIGTRVHPFFQLSNLIGIISLLIGSYGSYVIIPVGASLLTKYRFLLLFRLVDISQLLWSVQKFVGDLLGLFDLFTTTPGPGSRPPVLTPSAEAQFYNSLLLCVEMLFASGLATWWFHPSKCAFFDKFPASGPRRFDTEGSNNDENPEQGANSVPGSLSELRGDKDDNLNRDIKNRDPNRYNQSQASLEPEEHRVQRLGSNPNNDGSGHTASTTTADTTGPEVMVEVETPASPAADSRSTISAITEFRPPQKEEFRSLG